MRPQVEVSCFRVIKEPRSMEAAFNRVWIDRECVIVISHWQTCLVFIQRGRKNLERITPTIEASWFVACQVRLELTLAIFWWAELEILMSSMHTWRWDYNLNCALLYCFSISWMLSSLSCFATDTWPKYIPSWNYLFYWQSSSHWKLDGRYAVSWYNNWSPCCWPLVL